MQSNLSRKSLLFVLTLFAGFGLGCESPMPRDAPPDVVLGDPIARACSEVPSLGFSTIRRLTRQEYDNTIRDLLGTIAPPGGVADQFTQEEESLGYNNQAEALQVTVLHAGQFISAAEVLAAHVADRLELFPACVTNEDPLDAQRQRCTESFIRTFGQRAWRRPLTEAEFERYARLFEDVGDSAEPLRDGVELVAIALLCSPNFTYRMEVEVDQTPLPDHPDILQPTQWELASRLSYLLWQTMPDDNLFAAATAGELNTPEALESQARRMLASPRARPALLSFFNQWLRIDGVGELRMDEMVFPAWDERLSALWAEESRRFLEHVIFTDEADFGDLFTADYSFVEERLASLYGLEGVSGEAFVKVPLDPSQRSGILTHGSLLAMSSKPNETSPISRGILVLEQLFCANLPKPPDGVPVEAPDPDPTLATRDRLAAHSENPACMTCHRLIDPLGMGFEHYDALGRWRTRVGDHPVDAVGAIIEAGDANGPFEGAVEMGARLARSEYVSHCVAQQFFRYAMGRGDTRADMCAVEELQSSLTDKQDFLAVVLRLVKTDAFQYRRKQGVQ